jgi:protein-S-isoprenylcysteine O-methyltransferase Ste14
MEDALIRYTNRCVLLAFFLSVTLLIFLLGIGIVILGQALRSVAMITAAANFNHAVQFRKQDEHKLVTDGIYAYACIR